MQDVAGYNLNCTANDISIAKATVVNVQGEGCRYPGDTVTFTATFDVVLNASARYDVGLYFSNDGDPGPNRDGALTGQCTISTISSAAGASFVNLDGDVCGDIDSKHSPLKPTLTITAKCIDTDGDGYLNLPNCVSWRQPGSNTVCTTPTDAFPGAPSKCHCDIGFNVPIKVPPAQLKVTKTPNPAAVTEPGANVEFTVTVANDGIDPANSVTLNSLTDNVYGDITTVHGAIQSTTCANSSAITSNGSYTCKFTAYVDGYASGSPHVNTVTASGTDIHGNAVQGAGIASVAIKGVPPQLKVTKTPNPTEVKEPGGNVEFTVVMQNIAIDPANSITLNSLSDNIYGDITTAHGAIQSTACKAAAITANGSYTCKFTAFVDGYASQSPHIDTVTASGTDVHGNAVRGAGTASVIIKGEPPKLNLTKTPNPTEVKEPGGNVEFTVAMQNIAIDPANSVTLNSLSDNVYGDITTVHGAIQSTTCANSAAVAANGSYTCKFTAFVDGYASQSPHIDTVTASGTDIHGNAVQGAGTASVIITDDPPQLNVSKTPNPGTILEPGGNVEFTLVMQNSAIDPKNPIILNSIIDDVFGDVTYVHDWIQSTTCGEYINGPISPNGGTVVCKFTALVQRYANQGPHVDTVTASGTDTFGQGVKGSGSATVNIIDVPPSATVTKSATFQLMLATFSVEVKNTSVEPIYLTALTDNQFGDITAVDSLIQRTDCRTPQTIQTAGSYTCSFDALVSTTSHEDKITANTHDIEGNNSDPTSAPVKITVQISQ